MALATITFDLTDMLGVDFDPRRTKVWVDTNIPNDTIIDTTDGTIRLGSGNVTVNSDGTGTFDTPIPAATFNPASWQIGVHVDYPDRNNGRSGRGTRTFGPFTITASADLADLVAQEEIPPDFSSSAFIASVEAIRDEQIDISGIATSDALVEALVLDTGGVGPLTSAALSATIATEAPGVVGVEKRAAGGTFTTGNVMLFGDHAYAPAGIATAAVFGGALTQENVIGGNTANVDTATSNLTGAPVLADEDGNWNFLHGGYDTVVNGWACVVAGFHCKVEAGANHVVIAGGSRHSVAADSSYNTIGGGTLNSVSNQLTTVAGGTQNAATGAKATIGGGTANIASADSTTIAGGASNQATTASASVLGGNSNVASGNSSTIGGGLTNAASATGATVPGGRDNTASGLYSLATGRGAKAIEAHQHAHGSTPFAVAGDAQINRWVLKKQTTDATAGNLEADTGAPPVIPENATWAFNALITARRTDVDGDNAAFEVKGCFKRDAGSTAAMVGTPTVTALGASAGAATWTVTTGSFSVGTLRLIVTGEAAKTIRWVCELRAASASG